MAASEAELIRRYFHGLGAPRADVALGIGDDAALLQVPAGSQLVLTTDALAEGAHFLPGAAPRALGHRALAVNLSDIAAMGAEPTWMLLALILPEADEPWLAEFAGGLDALARRHGVALVGGNLCRGPLSITITLAGCVPQGQALRRDGARPGDALYVSGTLGDAAGGRELAHGGAPHPELPQPRELPEPQRQLRQRFECPQPRVALGVALRGLASACIDISDGLCVDATRLLQASGCAGQIDSARLPLSQALRQQFGARALPLALGGGEDYELLFSADAARGAAIEQLAARLGVPISRIGAVRSGAGLAVNSSNCDPAVTAAPTAFDHFSR
ncbi:MAG TPA: thiamine-phosphate kinase [Steroidobacteraceae bacterium]|nr:thiamine-phosphate kinase [Steroidobacteraceae bacterium]